MWNRSRILSRFSSHGAARAVGVWLLGQRGSVPIFWIAERYFVPPADLFRVSALLFHAERIRRGIAGGSFSDALFSLTRSSRTLARALLEALG
jgi:hypothetical protein